MDVDTALKNLTSFETFEPKQCHQYLSLYINSLHTVSDKNINNTLLNILSILNHNFVTIRTQERNGENYAVPNLPHHRLLLYRYLQKLDLNDVDVNNAKILHWKLVENISLEDDISEILKTINHMYIQLPFYTERFHLLEVMQKVSFNISKRCEKLVKITVHTIVCYFGPAERVSLLKRLFNLANFGVLEYFIASSLYDVARDVWCYSFIQKLMKYVLDGFADNNLAFAASTLFDTIVKSLEGDMINLLNSIIKNAFNGPPERRSRTLNMNFAKYIVPIYAKKLGALFYNYSGDMDLYYRLIVCKHVYIAKRCFKHRSLLMSLIENAARSNDTSVSVMGFELLCHYPNMRVVVSQHEIEMFKKMLIALPEMTPNIKKCIQCFISQIHISFNHTKTAEIIPTAAGFYEWIHELLHTNTIVRTGFADIVAEVYCFSLEILVKPSNNLVTPYTFTKKYDENPLYKILSKKCSELYFQSVSELYTIYIALETESPVIEKVLERIFYQSLTEKMAFSLMDKFFDLLPLNSPWTNHKTFSTAKILLKTLEHIKRHCTLEIMHNLVSRKIIERITKFLNPANEADVQDFAIFVHIEVLTAMMELTTINFNYSHECEIASIHLRDIIRISNSYCKRDFPRHKFLRKAIERSLVALINHIFAATKYDKYPEECVNCILNSINLIISSIPMKKVIVVASQRLLELVKATPEFEEKYMQFYFDQKAQYMDTNCTFNLRKSAGIRNIMHLFLKTMKNPTNFLEDEISYLIEDPRERLYQILLKVNLLECLINDADLKTRTQRFVTKTFEKALSLLNHRHFLIKNSAIQLVSAIATRTLGPLSEEGVREFCSLDFFAVDVNFCQSVVRNLYDVKSCEDIKICILGFLGESNSNGHLSTLPCCFDVKRLKTFFNDELFCDPAIKAFVACCVKNKLYDILMEEITSIDMEQKDELQLTNEVELLVKLSERYVESFPDSSQSAMVTDALAKVLALWHNDSNLERHVHKLNSNIVELGYTPIDLLVDNEETLSIAEGEGQVILKYYSKFIDKKGFSYNFHRDLIKELFKYLIGNDFKPKSIEMFYGIRATIVDTLNYLPNNFKPLESIFTNHLIQNIQDIKIQEIFIIITSQKGFLNADDIQNIDQILENCITILLQSQLDNFNSSSINIILNILENIVKFFFSRNFNISKFLLSLFIVTVILEKDQKLSKIYYFLTSGLLKMPKAALFLLLNHLELYLDGLDLQRNLLKNYLTFLSQPQDFNLSSVYLEPSDIIETINFQLKLSNNIIHLLNSLNGC